MIAFVVRQGAGFAVQLHGDDLHPLGPVGRIDDAAEFAELERLHRPRWVWNDTAGSYPLLLVAGVTVDRCHDVTAIERILMSRAGRYGEPAGAAAVSARRHGTVVLPDQEPAGTWPAVELGLFDAAAPVTDRVPLTLPVLLEAYVDQLERLPGLAGSPPGEAVDVAPGALRLLLAAESASALVAAEMGHLGMPWQVVEHVRILTEKLGARPPAGERPPAMSALAEQIDAAFGHPVNPDSALEVRSAFQRAGYDIPSTRSWVIREIEHPAVAPVLAYKELHRLYTANGWNWLGQWVRDGRFHAEYVAGGVVSGRWATRGGGALQIPKVVRSAVVAEPGFRLVVADAAQLEPRVLVAVSNDAELAALAGADDLYTALAQVGFSHQRAKAKLAMLGAMYGQTSGEAGRLLAGLRSRFPDAMDYVEQAARRGEQGRLVSSVLGRVCNPPGGWWQAVADGAGAAATPAQERRGRQIARDRGRFTRNFVIQASAADWAAVWLSCLRRELRAKVPSAELVFFQHDELMVHARAEDAAAVAELVTASANEASRLVFPRWHAIADRSGGPAGLVPVRPAVVSVYSDAK